MSPLSFVCIRIKHIFGWFFESELEVYKRITIKYTQKNKIGSKINTKCDWFYNEEQKFAYWSSVLKWENRITKQALGRLCRYQEQKEHAKHRVFLYSGIVTWVWDDKYMKNQSRTLTCYAACLCIVSRK